jgi:hypothetical protein
MLLLYFAEEVKLENLEDEGDARNGWLIKTRTKVLGFWEGFKLKHMASLTFIVNK